MKTLAGKILQQYKEGRIGHETAAELLRELRRETLRTKDIAVIGIGLDMPGAASLKDLAEVIYKGGNQIERFPEKRKSEVAWFGEKKGTAFKSGSYLHDISGFDHAYFGITPREAELMHPAQRIFLQTVSKALDDAGYGGNKIRHSDTGVFVGYGSDRLVDYKELIAEADADAFAGAFTGNLSSVLAGRIAFHFDLNGPAMVMDTACSSSLVAVDAAVGALRRGQCRMAIAGGIKLNVFPAEDAREEGIDIFSKDGVTYAFDSRATGTGLGEGSCALLLKPLTEAEADGDRIYAVIKGTAINHDGRTSGITVPNIRAQEEVLVSAWDDAGINPDELIHIEAHGTGTPLGDPIEVEALTRAFRRYTDRRQFCSLASAKANWGHLDNAAGILSLVKTIVIACEKRIPPALHFEFPNPYIDFCDSPVYVNDLARPVSPERQKRFFLGVSAFGLSGTNCHIVLSPAPEKETVVQPDRWPILFFLSAMDRMSLQRQAAALADFALEAENGQLTLLSKNYALGRRIMEYRLAVAAGSKQELLGQLVHFLSGAGTDVPFNLVVREPGTKYYGSFSESLPETHRRAAQLFLEKGRVEEELFRDLRSTATAVLPAYAWSLATHWIMPGGKERQVIIDGIAADEVLYQHKVLAAVLGKVLGLSRVHRLDNIISMGANSIHALQIANELSLQLNKKVSLSGIFESPVFADLAETLTAPETETDEMIEQVPRTGNYDLSAAQKSLWFTWLINPSNTAYNLVHHFLIRGRFDPARLESALRDVVRRHEVLGMRFTEDREEVRLTAHENKTSAAEFGIAERTDLDAASWENEVRNKTWKPFDLRNGPLIRLGLVRLQGAVFGLTIEQHHIITDAYSLQVFLHDLMQCYAGITLPPLPLQYFDYAAWHNRYLQSAEAERDREYWERKLGQEKTPEYLACDFPRATGTNDDSAGTIMFRLAEEEHDALRSLAARHGKTVHQVYVAMVNLLLMKLSGEERIATGFPVSGREGNARLGGLIGYFVNLLVMHIRISSGDSFAKILETTAAEMSECRKHQKYPFGSMVKLAGAREAGRHPFFDIQTDFNSPLESYDQVTASQEWSVEEIVQQFPDSKFDLSFQMLHQPEKTELMLVYKKSRYKEETISFAADQFRALLRQVHANDRAPVSSFTLLGGKSQGQTGEEESMNFSFQF